jgi:hypothetical protein
MAWLRKLRRERKVGTSRAYDNVLLATTIACIGTEVEENKPNSRRGSIVGRRTIARDRYSGYCRLMEDYFVSNSVYGENLFRRRLVSNYLPKLCTFSSSLSYYGFIGFTGSE